MGEKGWRKHCNAGGVRGGKAFVRWGAKATLIPITAHRALVTRFPPGMEVLSQYYWKLSSYKYFALAFDWN